MPDEVLTGGSLTPVVRRGDTVRRQMGPWTPGVHALLQYLRSEDFLGCPEVLGVDGHHEVLAHLPGEVLVYPPTGWFLGPTIPRAIGELLRRLHDAMPPLGEIAFCPPYPAEGAHEIVCHGDFSPTNLLFVGGRPSAVLDFDFAGPGPRAWDVASCLYRTAPLHAPELYAVWGQPAPSLPQLLQRARDFLAGYAFPVSGLLDTVEAQVGRHIRMIVSGDPMFDLPRRERHDQAYALDLAWLRHNRGTLEGELV